MAGDSAVALAANRPLTRGARLRRPTACDYCKLKKIRCNREHSDSCANCLDHAKVCTTTSSQPQRSRASGLRNKPSRSIAASKSLGLENVQPQATTFHDEATFLSPPASAVATLETAGLAHERQDDNASVASDGTVSAHQSFRPNSAHECLFSHHTQNPQGTTSSTNRANRSRLASGAANSPYRASSDAARKGSISYGAVSRPGSLEVSGNDRHLSSVENNPFSQAVEACEEDSIPSGEFANWEYHGPRSCLSLCSQSGVRWVESKTGHAGFRQSAQAFTADITKRLRLSKELSVHRMPDPNPVTAWKYTSAYFDHALDAAMGIVHRPTFEAQLRLYLQGASTDQDTAWHALRHTIYASGCRIVLSESLSFHEANNTAWSYFENALALLAGTILFQTSITSIQALTVMAYYSQNFGSPCLEYMLCNNALALAVAKGLHRQPAPGWNLSSYEHSQRSSLFWALYCLEKQIVKQSGRPSIIDDSEVTCPVPKAPLLCGAFNLKYMDILIQLARFSSTISKRLSSIRVLQTGAHGLARVVAELDWQLRDLRTRLEPGISLGKPVNPNRLPTGISLQQTVYLNCFYHTTMLDIHNTLTYPWSRTLLGLVSQPVLRAEAETSFEYVVETCHAAMLTLHYVHIDAATPVPLSFFTPIYVLTNLFICILQNPTHNQISLALSLMDLGVGFFTRLHIATNSTVSLQFAKELTSLAQGVVEKARNIATSGEDHDHEVPEVAEHAVQNRDGQDEHDPELSFCENMHRDNDIPQDVEIEQWSTLVPADMDLDGINFAFPEELHHY